MNSTHQIELQEPTPGRDRLLVRSSPRPIVFVGPNGEILRMREQAITSRSDLAVRSLTPELAEPLRRDAEARLWIFCHTLDLRMAVYLATHIRRYSPESRLLLLKSSQHSGFEELLFHRVVPVWESEGIFLDAVTELALSA